jgi:hypothetical protein
MLLWSLMLPADRIGARDTGYRVQGDRGREYGQAHEPEPRRTIASPQAIAIDSKGPPAVAAIRPQAGYLALFRGVPLRGGGETAVRFTPVASRRTALGRFSFRNPRPRPPQNRQRSRCDQSTNLPSWCSSRSLVGAATPVVVTPTDPRQETEKRDELHPLTPKSIHGRGPNVRRR